MKKEEFLERLEYLLQDIPEVDKRDAIDYYRDYLEEAGTENEESVLGEFGSPERISSIIRTDLLGGMESGGEFTENGFADQRFAKQELPAVSKIIIKEEETSSGSDRPETYKKGSYADQAKLNKKSNRKTKNNWLKFTLIMVVILVFAPIIFTVVIALSGGVIGIGGVLFAMLLVVGVLTFVCFACGILFFILGFGQLFFNIWIGVALIGLGLAFVGAGCLLLICSVLFYGSFLPWLFNVILKLFRRIFGRKQNNKTKGEGEA